MSKSCQHRSYFQISTVAFVFFAGRVSANLHAGVCVRSLGEDIVLVRNAVALGASCLEFFAWNKMQVQKPFMLWKKSWNHSKNILRKIELWSLSRKSFDGQWLLLLAVVYFLAGVGLLSFPTFVQPKSSHFKVPQEKRYYKNGCLVVMLCLNICKKHWLGKKIVSQSVVFFKSVFPEISFSGVSRFSYSFHPRKVLYHQPVTTAWKKLQSLMFWR